MCAARQVALVTATYMRRTVLLGSPRIATKVKAIFCDADHSQGRPRRGLMSPGQ
jgi:hypothetical protein